MLFLFFRHNNHLLRHSEEHLPGAEKITEREEADEFKAILPEAAIPDFPVMPLTLEHLKRVFHKRAHAGCLVIALALRG